MNALPLPALVLSLLILPLPAARAQVPDAIAVAGGTLVATMHAEGAQVYECKADASGKLVWQFREPIATLLVDGKTLGRHYAGPNWELVDGSVVSGKVAGRAPGATAKDIPLLKLEVASQRGTGRLTVVTTIQRLNTKGGVGEGPCETAGALPERAVLGGLHVSQEGKLIFRLLIAVNRTADAARPLPRYGRTIVAQGTTPASPSLGRKFLHRAPEAAMLQPAPPGARP